VANILNIPLPSPRTTVLFFTFNHVLVHKDGHDHVGIFRWKLLNLVVPWWMGIFYGVLPNNYAVAHTKIHHRYHNDLADVHTNWDLDRTKAYSFLLYLPRFALYWTSISPLWYFRVINPDRELFQKLLNGVIYYLSWCFFFYLLADLRFTLVFFVLPLPEAITFFAGISYLWHSFASPENPNDFYVSSVTILNGRQNMWNEDYHVAHHSAPHLHWTQYAEHFQKLKSQFEEHTATIFSDTEEGELFFLIMTKNWDKMATKFVDLSGKMTLEEKKQLIIQRLSHTVAA